MRFTCPSCSKSYRLSRERLGAAGGAKIRCPNCKTLVRVQVGDGDKLIAQLAEAAGARTTGGAARPAAQVAKGKGTSGATRPAASKAAAAPAAAAKAVWHVAVNQKAQGPLTIAAIQGMVDSGQIDSNCLAWKKGLAAWKKIHELPELESALNFAPAAQPARQTAAARSTLKTGAAHVPKGDGGDAPTIMADIPAAISAARAPTVPGGKAARRKEQLRKQAAERGMSVDEIEMAEARTMRPEHQPRPVRGGAMPRGKTGRKAEAPVIAPVEAVVPPTPAAKQAPAQAARAAAKAPPAKKAAPARQAAPAKEASPTKQATPAKEASPARKAATAKRGTSAKKTTSARKGGGATKGAPPAKAAGGAAQSMAFFESGEQLMADVEFDLPDPNKHKPTKEEYANLLQEFSVMFRLDKRSKRQKAGIVVVLTLLVVGVISFGVILYLQGESRQALIRDSKTILAVFNLPYQTSETVNLSQEAEQESAEFGEDSTKKARRGKVKSSSLAEKLRAKIRGRRIAQGRSHAKRVRVAAARRPKFKVRSAADLLGGQMDAAAQRAALVGAGGRTAKIVSVNMRKEPTKQVLKRLCVGSMPDLRACAKTHAGDATFKARVAVSKDGKVTGVSATVDGKSHSALSSCAFGKMKRKRVDLLTKSASITCAVN